MPLLNLPEPVIASSVFFRLQVNEHGTSKNPSRGRPAARLLTVALGCGFASGCHNLRGTGLDRIVRVPDVYFTWVNSMFL
jgi:hypothetical protein